MGTLYQTFRADEAHLVLYYAKIAYVSKKKMKADNLFTELDGASTLKEDSHNPIEPNIPFFAAPVKIKDRNEEVLEEH